jgi:hypothetical protein
MKRKQCSRENRRGYQVINSMIRPVHEVARYTDTLGIMENYDIWQPFGSRFHSFYCISSF